MRSSFVWKVVLIFIAFILLAKIGFFKLIGLGIIGLLLFCCFDAIRDIFFPWNPSDYDSSNEPVHDPNDYEFNTTFEDDEYHN